MEKATPRGLMTIGQLCENLQLSKQTIYALIWKRKIPCVKLSRRCVRFEPYAIDAWLAEKSFPAAGAQSPAPAKPPKKKKNANANFSNARIIDIVEKAKKEVLKK
jgi:excisionase family DNA binding protein